LPILEWAKAENVAVWVVSASPFWIVETGVAMLGIPAAHVVAMTPRLAGDRIEPALGAPAVYGPAKPQSLFGKKPGTTLLGAFGDSSYDAALLAASRVPVAVRPKRGLLERAAEVPGLVVLEG
jgi:phosphoserine phosphatase